MVLLGDLPRTAILDVRSEREPEKAQCPSRNSSPKIRGWSTWLTGALRLLPQYTRPRALLTPEQGWVAMKKKAAAGATKRSAHIKYMNLLFYLVPRQVRMGSSDRHRRPFKKASQGAASLCGCSIATRCTTALLTTSCSTRIARRRIYESSVVE